ncbi:hypothetical protein [endosymbiont GvMRE of Glomus versiforme]|uniref:hypothetical protein n=1 Tax=endosymbiont GvMRE of Glomus versiforme TaxID=2039283 RepID=UPI000EDDAC9B|nr:hypothetical protein [endosymbiont GvMRE of Glomus versiforme]RHZ35790.1 hypothetical protein GvMRE_Ic5g35 [endosymbiont GvMRE of Glomus versiforme]
MRNVNICFQDGTYKKIASLVERRKISRFVNEAVEEKLQKQKEELRKEMIAGYQENVKNKKLQKELEIWDRISGDGLSDE